MFAFRRVVCLKTSSPLWICSIKLNSCDYYLLFSSLFFSFSVGFSLFNRSSTNDCSNVARKQLMWVFALRFSFFSENLFNCFSIAFAVQCRVCFSPIFLQFSLTLSKLRFAYVLPMCVCLCLFACVLNFAPNIHLWDYIHLFARTFTFTQNFAFTYNWLNESVLTFGFQEQKGLVFSLSYAAFNWID